jgi:hypothetical protein
MRPTSKNLIFDVVKDWRWSPEAWKVMAQFFFYGFVAGLVLAVYLGVRPVKTSPHPTVTVTVPGPTYYTTPPKAR